MTPLNSRRIDKQNVRQFGCTLRVDQSHQHVRSKAALLPPTNYDIRMGINPRCFIWLVGHLNSCCSPTVTAAGFAIQSTRPLKPCRLTVGPRQFLIEARWREDTHESRASAHRRVICKTKGVADIVSMETCYVRQRGRDGARDTSLSEAMVGRTSNPWTGCQQSLWSRREWCHRRQDSYRGQIQITKISQTPPFSSLPT